MNSRLVPLPDGNTDEIARRAVSASDDSITITGTELFVDGGFCASVNQTHDAQDSFLGTVRDRAQFLAKETA